VVPGSGDPLAGTRYRSLRIIGEGGMGIVYEAEHREIGTQVVVKVLRGELVPTERIVDRMRVEAQSLGCLNHPNIVSVLDFDRLSDGRPFLVLERLRGQTLAERVRTCGPVPFLEAIQYQRQLLSALSAAHALGVVHRDVKPQNLFLHTVQGKTLLKVLDFGVAKIFDPALPGAPRPLSLPTTEGLVVGTPRYLAPEAALGEPLDQRSDLYSAGLVLYFMLVGKDPFDDVHGTDVLHAHARRKPRPPSERAPEPLPCELERIILRALAKSKGERFQTAAEFEGMLADVFDAALRPQGWLGTTLFQASDLEAALSSPPVQALAPARPRPPPEPESHRGAVQSAGERRPAGPARSHRPRHHHAWVLSGAALLFLLAGVAVVAAACWLLPETPHAR
jgi:serine/threonine-protein kinase